MSSIQLFILILIFLATSVIGVVTGSNSLIAVPAMFAFGIDERVAVATNMFGLTFMAIGAAIPFLRSGAVEVKSLWPMIAITLIGSMIGALIVGMITGSTIKVIVTVAMFAVVAFTLLRPKKRTEEDLDPVGGDDRIDTHRAPTTSIIGFVVVFLLAIYGGLYSGGYVTVLTAVLVAFFGYSFTQSIAATKLINVFSSFIATVVFLYQGLVDVKLGLILGVTMFIGGFVGAHFATKADERILRSIFYGAVLLLALKMLFDVVSR